MSKKIALIAGHGPQEPGAIAADHGREYFLANPVIGILAARLSKVGCRVFVIEPDNNSTQAAIVNNLAADLGLELHFNWYADFCVSGTETLNSGSKQGRFLAESIQKRLVAELGLRDRGCKRGYFRGDPSKGLITIIKRTRCPFVVPEPLFISNEEDLKKYDPFVIARALSAGVEDYLLSL